MSKYPAISQPAELPPPFLVRDGQVFINEALIRPASAHPKSQIERIEAAFKRRFIADLKFSWNN